MTNILSGIYSLVSSYIQPTDEKEDIIEPITAIPQSAINVHNMPRDQLIVQAIEDFQAPPLPILPPEYLRGGPIDIDPKPTGPIPEAQSGPVLVLTDNAKGGTPVSIPILDEEEDTSDPRTFKQIRQQFVVRKKRDTEDSDITENRKDDSESTTLLPVQELVNCTWTVKVGKE